jgi:hypothetical protein
MESNNSQESEVAQKEMMDPLPTEERAEELTASKPTFPLASVIPTLFDVKSTFAHNESVLIGIKDQFKVKPFTTREQFFANLVGAASAMSDAFMSVPIGITGMLDKTGQIKRVMDPSHYGFRFLELIDQLAREDAGGIFTTFRDMMEERPSVRETVPYTGSTVRTEDRFTHPMFEGDYTLHIACREYQMNRLTDPDNYAAFIALLDRFSGLRLPPMIDWVKGRDYFIASSVDTPFTTALRDFRSVQMWHWNRMHKLAAEFKISTLDNTDALTKWFRANDTMAAVYDTVPIEGSSLIAGAPVREMTDIITIFLTNRNWLIDLVVPEDFSIANLISILCIPMLVPTCVFSIVSLRRIFWYLSVHLLMRINVVRSIWGNRERIEYDSTTYDAESPFMEILDHVLGEDAGEAIDAARRRNHPIEMDEINGQRAAERRNGRGATLAPPERDFLTMLRIYFSGFSRNNVIGEGVHRGDTKAWVDRVRLHRVPDTRLHAYGTGIAPWTDVTSAHKDALSAKVIQFENLVDSIQWLSPNSMKFAATSRKSPKIANAVIEGLKFVRERFTSLISISSSFNLAIQRASMDPLAVCINDSDHEASKRARPKSIRLLTFGLMAMNADFSSIRGDIMTSERVQESWNLQTAFYEYADRVNLVDDVTQVVEFPGVINRPTYRSQTTSSERLKAGMEMFIGFDTPAAKQIHTLMMDEPAYDKVRWAHAAIPRDRRATHPFSVALEMVLSEPHLFGWTPMCGMKWNIKRRDVIRSRPYTVLPTRTYPLLDGDDTSEAYFYSYTNIGKINPETRVISFYDADQFEVMRDINTVINEIVASDENDDDFYVEVTPTVLFLLQRYRRLPELYDLQNRMIMVCPCPLSTGDQPIMVNGLAELFQSMIQNHVGPSVAIETREITSVIHNDNKISRASHATVPFVFMDRIFPEQWSMAQESPTRLSVGGVTWNAPDTSVATVATRQLSFVHKLNVESIPSLQKY